MERCRIFGLPDLDQDNPYVTNTLVKWVNRLIKTYQFDGMRLDTTPYIKPKFWDEFVKSAGVFSTGEIAVGVNMLPAYQRYMSTMDSFHNFPLYYAILDVFAFNSKNTSMAKLVEANRLQMKGTYLPDPFMATNFIENHDMPRFMMMRNDVAAYRSALVYMLASEGIPILLYGAEQSFGTTRRPKDGSVGTSNRSGGHGYASSYAYNYDNNGYEYGSGSGDAIACEADCMGSVMPIACQNQVLTWPEPKKPKLKFFLDYWGPLGSI